MEIQKAIVYNIFDYIEDPEIKNSIYDYFNTIISIVSVKALDWNKFRTRSGSRYVNEIRFGTKTATGIHLGIPIELSCIMSELTIVVQELLKLAKLTITDNSELVPIQLYLCYYQDGNDVCPMHKHKCRQITLSLGSDRDMTVNTKKKKL